MRFDKDTIIGVVGATKNKEKYGYKVFDNLLGRGFRVYPINPKYDEIEGVKCYKNLDEFSILKPGLIVVVTHPIITMEIVKKCHALGISQVWLQPGAENDEIIDYCDKNNIECVHHACIMMT